MGRGKRRDAGGRDLPLSDGDRRSCILPLIPTVTALVATEERRACYLVELLCSCEAVANQRRNRVNLVGDAKRNHHWHVLDDALKAVAIVGRLDDEDCQELRAQALGILNRGASDAGFDRLEEMESPELANLITDIVINDYDGEVTVCHVCGGRCSAKLAHYVGGLPYGNVCCWDERLRAVQ